MGYSISVFGTTYETVNTFADLPSAVDSADRIFIVLNASGNWYTLNRKDAGMLVCT